MCDITGPFTDMASSHRGSVALRVELRSRLPHGAVGLGSGRAVKGTPIPVSPVPGEWPLSGLST